MPGPEQNPTTKPALTVLAAAEDEHSRQEAVKYCDQLIQRFWMSHKLDVHWCNFKELEESRQARDAGEKAIGSDLIIFAARSKSDLPGSLKQWIESWVSRRKAHEGTIVDLVDCDRIDNERVAEKHLFLRTVAKRCAMDYLTQVPQQLSRSIPNSLESYSERAHRITRVLDDILQNPPTTRAAHRG